MHPVRIEPTILILEGTRTTLPEPKIYKFGDKLKAKTPTKKQLTLSYENATNNVHTSYE